MYTMLSNQFRNLTILSRAIFFSLVVHLHDFVRVADDDKFTISTNLNLSDKVQPGPSAIGNVIILWIRLFSVFETDLRLDVINY